MGAPVKGPKIIQGGMGVAVSGWQLARAVALTGQMTFPQVLVGERSVGGFRELVETDRDGTLEDLLKPSSNGGPA